MQCQKCGSTRILVCNAKASDCQDFSLRDREYEGEAPHVSGLMGGDYISPDICLDCGQVQGFFPKPLIEELELPIGKEESNS